MTFDSEDWFRRLKLTKTKQDMDRLLDELPDPGVETDPYLIWKAAQKSSTTEPAQTSKPST